MSMYDIPVEVLEKILHACVLSRSVPRALRLKLVCKSFYDILTPRFLAQTFAETRALDYMQIEGLFRDRHMKKRRRADFLMHDYLVQRCLAGEQPEGRYADIRCVAIALIQHCKTHNIKVLEDGTDELKAVLDHLCWLALERGVDTDEERNIRWSYTKPLENEPKYGRELLAAGTHLGIASLVQEQLDKDIDPTKFNSVFPSAVFLAAYTGQDALIQCFKEQVHRLESLPTYQYEKYRLRTIFWTGILRGAAAKGDMEMLHLALHPPSRYSPAQGPTPRPLPGETGIETRQRGIEEALGLESGMLPLRGMLPFHDTRMWHIDEAIRAASSPEVWQYLWDFTMSIYDRRGLNYWSNTCDQEFLEEEMTRRIKMGDTAMVRHLLDMGVPLMRQTFPMVPQLAYAVRSGHHEVLDLLFQRGADPNEGGHYRKGTLLTAAAKLGSMRILDRMFAAGASLTKLNDLYTLKAAINAENTEMVGKLLDEDLWTRRSIRFQRDAAKRVGLESMVELLESRMNPADWVQWPEHLHQ